MLKCDINFATSLKSHFGMGVFGKFAPYFQNTFSSLDVASEEVTVTFYMLEILLAVRRKCLT